MDGHLSRSHRCPHLQELVLLGEIEALSTDVRPVTKQRIAQATLETFAAPASTYLPRSKKTLSVYEPSMFRCWADLQQSSQKHAKHA